MINKYISALIICVVASISGCASAPTADQMANADYGRPHTPEECVVIVEERIKLSLKDPMSAIFTHQNCYKGASNNVPLLGRKAEFGYLQVGTVNAKNSFGGYVGARTYQALIKNGAVFYYCIADENGLCI